MSLSPAACCEGRAEERKGRLLDSRDREVWSVLPRLGRVKYQTEKKRFQRLEKTCSLWALAVSAVGASWEVPSAVLLKGLYPTANRAVEEAKSPSCSVVSVCPLLGEPRHRDTSGKVGEACLWPTSPRIMGTNPAV